MLQTPVFSLSRFTCTKPTHASLTHPQEHITHLVSFWMRAHIFALWREHLPRCFVVSESVWEHTLEPELWVVGGKQMWIEIFATLLPAGLKISWEFNDSSQREAVNLQSVLCWWRTYCSVPSVGLTNNTWNLQGIDGGLGLEKTDITVCSIWGYSYQLARLVQKIIISWSNSY